VIPLFDLRLEEPDIEAVLDVLRSGELAMGARVAEFEAAFAAHLGARHAIALSSCTAALHLAYLAAGVGPGDEVIVPAMTFAATAAAVVYCGATPVFAEITGPHELALDPADVERRITERTKAVCTVHFAGYPATPLRELCDAHGLALIEDSAHAPLTGVSGLAAAYSFFSNKVLACGEGGLLATDDDAVAERVRELRGQYGYKLDEPRAALLLARLPRIHEDVARRRELTRAYRARLEGVTVPYDDAAVERSSCYVMPVLVEPERRDALREHLRERGVQTSILYPAIHEFTAYRERFGTPSLPRTEHVARAEITLPLFPHMTEAQLDQVVEGLR